MNLNATLIVQMITFALFVWFTMTMVWPHVLASLEERRKKISEGLAAADKAKRDLAFAEKKIIERTRQSKIEAAQIIELANKRANLIIDDAKAKAHEESARLLELAQIDITKEVESARRQLRERIAILAITAAEKILAREVDSQANQGIIDSLVEEI